MRPATIRRLLVFGVCALGVVGLYLVPGVMGPSARVDDSRNDADSRSTTPESVRYVGHESPAPAAGDGSVRRPATGEAPGVAEQSPTGGRPDGAGQVDRPDHEAPSTVSGLTVADVTPAHLTIRWSQATDNVSVARYRVWLNGFEVADTTDTQAEVKWFNDGSRQQVVQVRALDAAGNQSTAAPARLVERPRPQESASPSPGPGTGLESGKPSSPAEPDASTPDQSAPVRGGSTSHGAPSSAPSPTAGSPGGGR